MNSIEKHLAWLKLLNENKLGRVTTSVKIKLALLERSRAQMIGLAIITLRLGENMSASFLNHLEWRNATKAFDKTKPVSDANLDLVLQAIRMAPSSFGLQPFQVEVIKEQSMKEKLLSHSWNQPQITTCQTLLVFVARTNFEKRIGELFDGLSGGNADARAQMADYEKVQRSFISGRTEDELKAWAQKQAYIALGFALAACAELQIDSCPMEGIVGPEYDKVLALPKGHYSSVVLAVGYRDAAVPVNPKFRFPLKDLFHKR